LGAGRDELELACVENRNIVIWSRSMFMAASTSPTLNGTTLAVAGTGDLFGIAIVGTGSTDPGTTEEPSVRRPRR
jgi:hypothetical protein